MLTRRHFLASSATLLSAQTRRPNVVLIITDDQGFGDLSIHGNPHLRTANMDRIGREGARFTQFQVCPVCSPTRSSLMTGRYNYRTGVVDTYLGRSMMHPDEVTLPELLRDSGYRTGIFGKWHLGDNYPMRAMDQGFQSSVVLRGGGLGQPSDVPDGGGYFNPILSRDGKLERFKGYCTDIFANQALSFIDRNAARPFFLYLATNAPHDPLQIADNLVAPYRKLGLDERTAKTYAMIANVDTNIGRVLARLKARGIDQDTIVIFMTDNGPQRERYNAGMRGTKGTVYQGGIRVPFFVRWPAVVKPGIEIDRIAAHIDVLPTLLDACGVRRRHAVDGRSLLPLLRDPQAQWADRTLFTQWHRGDAPQPFRNSAVRNQRWKLVEGKELYDLAADPAEKSDIASSQPETVKSLRTEYEKWFQDVSSTRGYAPPRIAIGTPHENPVVLTRQDWRGERAGWTPESLGHWEVNVAEAGEYEVKVRVTPRADASRVTWQLNGASLNADIPAGAGEVLLGNARVPKGEGRVTAEVSAGASTLGVNFVEVRRLQ